MGKRLKFLVWAALSAVGIVLAVVTYQSNDALEYVILFLCIVSRFACGILAAIDAYRLANRINAQMTPEEIRQSLKLKRSRG